MSPSKVSRNKKLFKSSGSNIFIFSNLNCHDRVVLTSIRMRRWQLCHQGRFILNIYILLLFTLGPGLTEMLILRI